MAIVCKSVDEIEKMRRSGRIVREVLDYVRTLVAPGVSTMDIERAAEQKIKELKAKPAFKGYYEYPCVLCTSINDEIVHGIPSEKRELKAGDIVSIDCGVIVDGFYSDCAVTYAVGQPSEVDASSVGELQRDRAELRVRKTEGKLGCYGPDAGFDAVGAVQLQEALEIGDDVLLVPLPENGPTGKTVGLVVVADPLSDLDHQAPIRIGPGSRRPQTIDRVAGENLPYEILQRLMDERSPVAGRYLQLVLGALDLVDAEHIAEEVGVWADRPTLEPGGRGGELGR